MINEPFCGRIDCFANHNSGLCRILQYGYYGENPVRFIRSMSRTPVALAMRGSKDK